MVTQLGNFQCRFHYGPQVFDLYLDAIVVREGQDFDSGSENVVLSLSEESRFQYRPFRLCLPLPKVSVSKS